MLNTGRWRRPLRETVVSLGTTSAIHRGAPPHSPARKLELLMVTFDNMREGERMYISTVEEIVKN